MLKCGLKNIRKNYRLRFAPLNFWIYDSLHSEELDSSVNIYTNVLYNEAFYI